MGKKRKPVNSDEIKELVARIRVSYGVSEEYATKVAKRSLNALKDRKGSSN